jgi:N-hydroxyarylamine O-acetyltransferase
MPMQATLDVDAYLARIGYSGPRGPTIATLRALHTTHARAVPFENLDIHLGRHIVLDQSRIVAKIVNERRGGFCYEVNGGFAALIEALGFPVTLLSAGVTRDDGSFGPEFDHLLLRVDLDEPWLADVSTFIEPIRLAAGVQHDSRNRFRLDEAGQHIVLNQQNAEGAWSSRFRFTLESHQFSDFAEMCDFHQTSPESHFTRSRICSLPTADGRVSLTDGRLIVSHEGQRTESPLADEIAFSDALLEHFGIVLPRH